ncbi:MAG: exopolysaccharide biosynthesis polyprenyl glycosylphosphotransferase [Planctomycetota bacterium]|jgi:exopolysaccharide biosynthesis polyprenyl glycosylphosphotransferase
MSTLGNYLRRNFEPLILSAQVFVDLGVLLLSCWLGYLVGWNLGSADPSHGMAVYRQVWALMSAVSLVSFHAFGMYRPTKSLLNMEEFKAIAKATVVSFFVFWTLLILLGKANHAADDSPIGVVLWLHEFVDLDFDPVRTEEFSRVTVVISFGLILFLTTASRFASFKYIQSLHRRGIGNRNVLILGTNEWGKKLRSKLMLVPTLGMNLVGFVTEDEVERQGEVIDRVPILGGRIDIPRIVAEYKVSEIFVAMPDSDEEEVMEILSECERIGVKYHVVPRFYHLLSYKIRIHNVDSIPLITRADRRHSLSGAVTKRSFDLLVSSLVLLIGAPLFALFSFLIRRESEGRALFVQERVGRDGKAFRMFKFRTMHLHSAGDAPTPNSPFDPRITRIGRYLRRYSLDEFPQFINVFLGNMSLVGPRPEMKFIVEDYSAVQRERLRAKPGITGLWQISFARQNQIHDNLDYDLYYIEHQSLLLDLVICALTGFAVIKGTGAF